MDVFSIGDGNEYKLTRENFLSVTHKRFPYYQNPQKYKSPYFAICPACNNPVQIINLFGTRHIEEHTRRTNLHARHYPNNVEGLPHYNKERYINCPLHNPIAFRIIERRNNDQINEEIYNIIQKNKNKICADIRKIIGILIPNNKLKQVIDDYIMAKDYCYTHTNKFNIPYSILYTRNALNIFGQKVYDSDIGQRISHAIQNNSIYFQINNNRIEKTISDYVTLNLLILNHRIREDRQYMTIRIEEQNVKNLNLVYEENIELKQHLYQR